MACKIVVIGGGEHARVVMDACRKHPGKWELAGFTDVRERAETEERCGVPRLGGDEAASEYHKANPGAMFVMGIGGDGELRKKIVGRLGIPADRWAVVTHPEAVISEKAVLGPGTVVLARAVVQTGARLGSHCIVNTGSIVEHDCVLGDFVHLAPGSVLGGGCEMGESSFTGIGARVRDHIRLGKNSVIGLGSVVVSNIPDGATVAGVPAKPLDAGMRIYDIGDLCLPPDATIYEAMSIIGKFGKYGTVLAMVTDHEKRLLGTITDGDIRRALLKHNDLNLKVSECMNRDCKFLEEGAPRYLALDIMKAKGISQMPVVDKERRVVGLHLMSEMIGNVTRPNRAVIMAGGKGQRLKPITESVPKPMVKVAGRPILEHIILHLAGSNIRKISVSVNYLGEMIEDYFKDGSHLGCEISYIRETTPLGTAGALRLLEKKEREPLLVMNGDLVTNFSVEKILAEHQGSGNVMTVGSHEYRLQIPYGVLEPDAEGRIASIREKPEERFLVNGGVYVMNPGLLELIPPDKEYFMTQLIQECLDRKQRVGHYILEGDWIDIGAPPELAKARGC